jgi:phenylpyruvate tautomerase PptA (4-oxalocrotonate tautomerase family)
MPVVRIEIKEGHPDDFLKTLMDCIHESMVECLKIPTNDRNIRVLEYRRNLFQAKEPYELFIEILLFSGRQKDTKSLLYKSIVISLQQKLAIDPASVFIVLNEQPKENWGIRGGINASDFDLGFNVQV